MRVVIVGGGSLGTRTARILTHRKHEVVVIESESARAESIRESLDCGVICGDGTRPAVLTEAEPSHTDALLALTSNARTNLISGLIGRSVGFARVITRIDDEEFEHVALELGLSDTIVPARTIGRYLADVVEGHDVLELSGAIKGDARIFVFVAREEDEGTLEELKLPSAARVSHLFRGDTLVLAEHKSAVRQSSEEGNACPNYWHFSPYGFCPFGCAYCYLAGVQGVRFSPTVKVFLNLPEILAEVDRVARRVGEPTAFYLGKLQDGLALDPGFVARSCSRAGPEVSGIWGAMSMAAGRRSITSDRRRG